LPVVKTGKKSKNAHESSSSGFFFLGDLLPSFFLRQTQKKQRSEAQIFFLDDTKRISTLFLLFWFATFFLTRWNVNEACCNEKNHNSDDEYAPKQKF